MWHFFKMKWQKNNVDFIAFTSSRKKTKKQQREWWLQMNWRTQRLFFSNFSFLSFISKFPICTMSCYWREINIDVYICVVSHLLSSIFSSISSTFSTQRWRRLPWAAEAFFLKPRIIQSIELFPRGGSPKLPLKGLGSAPNLLSPKKHPCNPGSASNLPQHFTTSPTLWLTNLWET